MFRKKMAENVARQRGTNILISEVRNDSNQNKGTEIMLISIIQEKFPNTHRRDLNLVISEGA